VSHFPRIISNIKRVFEIDCSRGRALSVSGMRWRSCQWRTWTHRQIHIHMRASLSDFVYPVIVEEWGGSYMFCYFLMDTKYCSH